MVEQMIIELNWSPIAVVVVIILVFFSPSSEAQSTIQPATPLTFGTTPTSTWDVSSVCVIIGSLIATLLVVFVLLILLRRFTISHSNYVEEYNNKCESCNGIHPQLLQTFPILCYSPSITNLKEGPLQLQCAVCLAEFNYGDTLRLLPQCNHIFHPPCIDAWLSSHVTCPVCRANLSHHHHSLNFATVSVDPETSGGSGSEEEGKRNGEEEEDKGGRENASKVRKLMRSNSTGHSVVDLVVECVEKKNCIMQRSASCNFARSLC